jgi:hypothetical protein
LVTLVQELMDNELTELERMEKIERLQNNIIDPKVADYVYSLDKGLSAEQIVEKALRYKPILL